MTRSAKGSRSAPPQPPHSHGARLHEDGGQPPCTTDPAGTFHTALEAFRERAHTASPTVESIEALVDEAFA